MPKLPRNMVRRSNRPGYYFRQKRHGETTWIALGEDYPEACRKLRQLKGQDSRPVAHWTVENAAVEWFRTYVPNARNAYGQKQTADRIRLFLKPFLGHLLLHKIVKQDVRAYRTWLESRGLAPATVKHVLSDLRCLLNWAEDAGYIERSPFPKRIMPKLQERPPDRLWEEELEAVTGIAEPYGFAVRFVLATGLRWSELVRAQSTDIEYVGSRAVLVVHRTKSGKLRRIPIPKWFEPELRDRVGKLVPFANSDHFNRAVRLRSGIQRFHVHQLRHTFACQWLERDGSLAALQELMGHASIVTTQRYARLSHDMVMREAERIEGPGVAKGVAKQTAL